LNSINWDFHAAFRLQRGVFRLKKAQNWPVMFTDRLTGVNHKVMNHNVLVEHTGWK
jgi:hypothetical protein